MLQIQHKFMSPSCFSALFGDSWHVAGRGAPHQVIQRGEIVHLDGFLTPQLHAELTSHCAQINLCE